MNGKTGTLVLPGLPYAAAIAAGWWLDRHVFPIPLTAGAATMPLAILFILGGSFLQCWTLWEFTRQHTTVNPFGAAKHLCVSGPMRFSRNPIYVGDWLFFAGFSLWFETLWPFVFSPIVWAVMRYFVIRHEEEHLEAKFGDEYRQFRAKVRRWL